jgi:hypothetical protein
MSPAFVLVPGAGGESWYWHLVAQSMGAFVAPLLPDRLDVRMFILVGR